jgi:hypothetical protein
MPQYDAGSAAIKVTPSFRDFTKEVRAELSRYDFHLDINIGADTRVAAAEIELLRRAARENVTMRVDANTDPAAAQIARMRASARRPVTIRPEIDRAAANQVSNDAQKTAKQLKADLDKALGGLRSAAGINLKVLGVIGAAGAIAQLAAITDAAGKASRAVGLIPAISFAGLAGVAGLATGLSGITGAFKAATAASKDSADAVSAQRDSVAAVAEAEYQLDQANRSAVSSQRALSDVYKDASRSLRDMNDNLVDQKFATQDAALSVQEAAQRLQKVQFDPTADSTQRARARLSYDEAVQRLKEQQQKTQDLQQDTAVANQKGVEGSDQVTDAKQRINDALHAQTRAELELAKARETGSKGTASQTALDQAMAKLSPNAKELVTDIRALGPAWTEARKASQDALTNGMGPAVTNLAAVQLPNLRDGLVGVNTAINGGLRASIASLASDTNRADFKTSLDNTAQGFANAAKGAGPFTDAMTKLITVGTTFLPGFGTAVDHAAERFNNLIQRTAADGSLKKWLQDGVTATTQLAETIGHIGSSIASVFRAAGDDGNSLKRIEDLTDKMSKFLKSTEGQNDLKSFFGEARADMDRLKPVLANLPSILHSVYEGFQTWAGIALPFLKAAGDFLSEHPTLVRNVVVAYLAFKTIAPIVNLVTFAVQRTRLEMAALQASVGFSSGTMQAGFRSVAGLMTGVGLALAAVSVAAIGMSGEYSKASRQSDILNGRSRELAVTQREMAKAFQESNGAISGDVLSSMSAQIDKVTADAERLAETMPGAFSVFTGGAADIKGWFSGQAQAGTDAVHAQEDVAEAAARTRDSFKELGLSSSEMAKLVSGSNGQFNDLIDRLHATANGGADAEAEVRKLRQELLHTQQLAKDSTPGFFALTTAVETLSNSASSASDRLNAMKTALDILAGKPLAAQDALAKYNEQVRETTRLAQEWDQSQGSGSQLFSNGQVDTTTANGKRLFDALNDIRDRTLNAAVAGNELDPILAKNGEQFQILANAVGLTKEQIMQMAASVGYLPTDIRMLASLEGATDVTQKLVVIADLLTRNREGVVIPATALTKEARDELARLKVTIEEIPGTDEVRIVAKTEQALADLQAFAATKLPDMSAKVNVKWDFEHLDLKSEAVKALNSDVANIESRWNRADGGIVQAGDAAIANRPINQWAEAGPEAYIPLSAGKRDGAVPIWLEAGRRLGMVTPRADGGIVESMNSVVAAKFPALQLTSGLRYTDNGYHSVGKAADFSNGSDDTPEMQGLAQYIATNFPQSLELIHQPFGHNIKDGRDVGDGLGVYGASTMGEHRSHVHWAVASPVTASNAAPATASATPGANTSTVGSAPVLSPQAALPGRQSDQQLQILSGQASVDSANSERNAVYANSASTDQDRLAADLKYQQAQNSLESTQKSNKSDTSALSLQGIFSKAGGILANGILGFFGLENSILSDSNVYNRALNTTVDFYGKQNSQLGGGYGYQPKNLPGVATTLTPQSSGTDLTTTIPGAGPVTGAPLNPDLGTLGGLAVTVPGRGSNGAGAAQWKPLALQALQREGFSTGQVDIMLAQIQSESGGDANISQQITDVNGTGDAAGVGLLQVIPSTFAAFRDPSLPNDRRDPAANMAAALRYYKSRYGTDLSTQWGQGHGYADGGWVEGIGGSRGDGIRAPWVSPGEFVVNAYDAARHGSTLEAINSSTWSPARIDSSALNVNAQAAGSRGGHDFSTTIVEPRLANVNDLVDLAERQAQMKAIGLSAALP